MYFWYGSCPIPVEIVRGTTTFGQNSLNSVWFLVKPVVMSCFGRVVFGDVLRALEWLSCVSYSHLVGIVRGSLA